MYACITALSSIQATVMHCTTFVAVFQSEARRDWNCFLGRGEGSNYWHGKKNEGKKQTTSKTGLEPELPVVRDVKTAAESDELRQKRER